MKYNENTVQEPSRPLPRSLINYATLKWECMNRVCTTQFPKWREGKIRRGTIPTDLEWAGTRRHGFKGWNHIPTPWLPFLFILAQSFLGVLNFQRTLGWAQGHTRWACGTQPTTVYTLTTVKQLTFHQQLKDKSQSQLEKNTNHPENWSQHLSELRMQDGEAEFPGSWRPGSGIIP